MYEQRKRCHFILYKNGLLVGKFRKKIRNLMGQLIIELTFNSNWVIFCVLIGGELWRIRVYTM